MKKNYNKKSELPAKYGISGQKGANNYDDKSIIDLPRQQVAFRKECRKIKGCGSLEEEFYTRFKPNFM